MVSGEMHGKQNRNDSQTAAISSSVCVKQIPNQKLSGYVFASHIR